MRSNPSRRMADTTSDLAALGVPLRQTVSPSTACHWAAGSVLGPPCVVTYERKTPSDGLTRIRGRSERNADRVWNGNRACAARLRLRGFCRGESRRQAWAFSGRRRFTAEQCEHLARDETGIRVGREEHICRGNVLELRRPLQRRLIAKVRDFLGRAVVGWVVHTTSGVPGSA
jgi:hypothetical protein